MEYRNLSRYLREKYGTRVGKICIDGGFSCPNRDGTCGEGGCIYCGERGAGEHIDPNLSIREQVEKSLSDARADDYFIAYFQNFTNTYAPVEVLRERYDSALIDDRIKILSVGTRPDCISEDVCRLLSEYQRTREVWVELGLQTASDRTAALINRGYMKETFCTAMSLLKKYSIPTVVHIMIGLPGEGMEEIKETAAFLSKFELFGIKIHSVYVMRGTRLAEMYEQKLYTPPTLSEYADATAYILKSLPKSTVVHRLTGDCPRDELVAPEWNRDKNKILEEIRKRLI